MPLLIVLSLLGADLPAAPLALPAIESAAEDVYDAANGAVKGDAGRWAKVDKLLDTVRKAAAALSAAGPSPELEQVNHAVAELRLVVGKRDALATQMASNRLALKVADLYANYQAPVPVDLKRLDALLRSIELSARARDASEQAALAERAGLLWLDLSKTKPIAGTKAKEQLDAQMSAVTAAVNARDAAGLGKAVGQALEGVDAVERLFRK